MRGRVPAITVLLLTLMAGCNSSARATLHFVRGRVFLDEKPLAQAQVVLHPVQETSPPHPKPLGITDQDGYFQLTTFKTHDGAPEGSYRITVELRAMRLVGEEQIRAGQSLLPARYSQPAKSGLTCVVTSSGISPSDIKISSR
jgi:hypothetical protein